MTRKRRRIHYTAVEQYGVERKCKMNLGGINKWYRHRVERIITPMSLLKRDML